MMGKLKIEPLADHPEFLPSLQCLFETEWASYYGSCGPGNAQVDLKEYANKKGFPFGVVAILDGNFCGAAVLKNESISTHPHLYPWAAAGIVTLSFRRQGIGSKLLAALETAAKNFGFSHIYCGTNTANNVLERQSWQLLEWTIQNGEKVGIYEKKL